MPLATNQDLRPNENSVSRGTENAADTLRVNEIYLSLQGESTFAGLPCIFIRLTACDLRCSYCDTAYAFTEGKRLAVVDILAEINRLAEPFRPMRKAEGGRRKEEEVRSPRSEVRIREDSALRIPQSAWGNVRSDHGLVRLPLVELTGGEPLLQKNSLLLMTALCEEGLTVLLETSGAHDISKVDSRVRRIMDLKCPSSGEAARNLWENLRHVKSTDEIKFVIGTVEDYEWAKAVISERALAQTCPLLFSWVHPLAPEQQHPSLKSAPSGQTPISRRALAERIIADALPVRFQVQLHKIIWPPEQRGV